MAYNDHSRVVWNDAKNLTNQKKHGLSFEEASTLFRSDVDVVESFDEAHSDLEDRVMSLGPIARGIVLVIWTEREDGVIRIISARWATPREQQFYFSHHAGSDG